MLPMLVSSRPMKLAAREKISKKLGVFLEVAPFQVQNGHETLFVIRRDQNETPLGLVRADGQFFEPEELSREITALMTKSRS